MDNLIEEFMDFLEFEKKYSENTISNYKMDLDRFSNYANSIHLNFKKMDYTSVTDYLIYLKKSNLSKTSINRHLSSLRSFYKYLLKKGITENNPFTLLKGPKSEKKLPKYLKYDEFLEIVDACDETFLGIRNRLILELLFASGVRVGELVNIKLKDINIGSREVRIIGKGKKERIVYYNKVCAEVLNNYLNNSRGQLLKNKKSDYLLVNHIGNKLTTRGIENIIDRIILKTSSHRKISPHTLRHTFATLLLNEGMDIREVQELLGHSRLTTTSIYTHVTNNKLREVYLKYNPRSKMKSK